MSQGTSLSGNFRVRIFRPAFKSCRKLCGTTRNCIELRRHALKLRYWPDNYPVDDQGQVVDLNWEWIRSLPNSGIGELRIDDVISNNDNLRLIFFVGDKSVKEPLPMIWILSVLQKKRDDFTRNQIKIFKGQKQLVLERFYKNRIE